MLSAACAALALVAAGCGSDSNAPTAQSHADITCATGTLTGGGSTFAQNIAQEWVKTYIGQCPGSTIDYKGIGSSAGIQQFTAGTIDFGATDVPLKAEERTAAEAKYGKVVQMPWAAGGIAVMFNLPGIQNVNLSGQTLASVFAGKIAKWDDPAVKADNPGVTLPALPIQVVHRSDGSGTTGAFTAYLTAAAPSVWTYGASKDVPWPAGQGAKGSDGVTAAVKQTAGAIGYAELSYAKANSLGLIKIKNVAGKYVGPDAAAVTAALAEAKSGADNAVAIEYAPKGETAYPLSTVTYVLLPASMPADKVSLAKSFVKFALGDGQDSAEGLQYAPLPKATADAQLAVLDSIATK